MGEQSERSRIPVSPNRLPDGLVPSYSTANVNAPVSLYHGQVHLHLASGRTAIADGVIELSWLPFPCVRFDVPDTGLSYHHDDLAAASLYIPEHGAMCDDALVTSISIEPNRCRGILQSPVIVGQIADCHVINFGVANFVRYVGEAFRRGTMASACRMRLEGEGIRLTMDEVEGADDLVAGLKGEGGFALTHVGSLERIDGQPMAFEEAMGLLSASHSFLSFARGSWCGAVLPVGLRDGERLWESWGPPKQTPWRYVESWLPHILRREDMDQLGRAFGGFLDRWHDQFWQDPVRAAIHWYVVANTGASGVEGTIILAQTALELLGWARLAEDPLKAVISRSQFDKLHADEQIRSLLCHLGIPTDMPPDLRVLHHEAHLLAEDESATIDGPTALVRLRNALVHPRQRRRALVSSVPVPARMEAADLGLWYLELVLLRLCGYEGEYYLRFPKGTPEEARRRVPWA